MLRRVHIVLLLLGVAFAFAAVAATAPGVVAMAPGGDPSLSVSPTAFTITRVNWTKAQTVTITAAEDADGIDGTAIFRHNGDGR